MINIDAKLLDEIGLGALPAPEKDSLLKHIYETLEMRVGMRLADQMSNEQLDEFERYFEAKDDAGAFKWLETNFPNYKDIVQEEFDKLKLEVGQTAPQILAASQAQAAQVPAAPAPTPTPQPAFPQPQAPQPQYQELSQQPSVPQYAQPAPAPVPQPQPLTPVYDQPAQPQYQPPAAPPVPQSPPVGPAGPYTPQPTQPAPQPQYPPQQPPAGPNS